LIPILPKSQAAIIRSLNRTNIRKKQRRILVEGHKCCSELLNSGFIIDYFVVNSEQISATTEQILATAEQRKIPIYQTKESVFLSLCDTQSPQPILALSLPTEPNILPNESFVALDNVSDPGNVGTIIRTCE